MVTEWGMSDVMGPLSYGEPAQEVFLGHSVTQHKNVSDSTASQIDKEIRKIVETAYDRARHILREHIDQLHALAKGLLEYETLSGEEINTLLKGGKIDKLTPTSPDKPKKPRSSTPTRKPALSPEPSA
jgi:cell division protease FtsH